MYSKMKFLYSETILKNISLQKNNNMAKGQIKSYSLEEMEDKYIGKKGIPARDKYEYELRRDVLGFIIKKGNNNMLHKYLK
jgi:hypothetical protein